MMKRVTPHLSWAELSVCQGFPGGSLVKNPPAIQKLQETWVQPLGREDALEEGMATHSSIFAWRIPMDRGGWQAAVHGVAEDMTEVT